MYDVAVYDCIERCRADIEQRVAVVDYDVGIFANFKASYAVFDAHYFCGVDSNALPYFVLWGSGFDGEPGAKWKAFKRNHWGISNNCDSKPFFEKNFYGFKGFVADFRLARMYKCRADDTWLAFFLR